MFPFLITSSFEPEPLLGEEWRRVGRERSRRGGGDARRRGEEEARRIEERRGEQSRGES